MSVADWIAAILSVGVVLFVYLIVAACVIVAATMRGGR